MSKNLAIKVLPYYIAADHNQNMSIWFVVKSSIEHSKYKDNTIIVSPNTALQLTEENINIHYLSKNAPLTAVPNNEITNWNMNYNITREDHEKLVIDYIKNLNPALIEVEGDYRLAANLAKKFKKVPTILVAHTIFAKRNFFTRVIQYFRYIRHIKNIIFVSEGHKNYYQKSFWYSFKKNFVIHNSYSHLPTQEINLETKKNQIIFAGRATKNKGYQEYLLSLVEVLQHSQGWEGLAVLSIESQKIAKEVEGFLLTPKIKELILTEKVKIIRNLPNKQLFNKFCESKIAVFPTHKTFIEGLPLVGVEAHMAKCAVIASNNVGFKELSGENAVFLKNVAPKEIANKINYLIKSPETLKKLAINGYNQTKTNFNIKHLVTLYDSIRRKYLSNP